MNILRIVSHAACFDGLVSALLMQEILGIEDVIFIDPGMVEQGFRYHKSDAVVDLPWAPDCGLWIDHHSSNTGPSLPTNHHDPTKKSCAQFIYDLYKKHDLERFSSLVHAANKIDKADFAAIDISKPDAAIQLALSLQSGNLQADEQYANFLLQELRFRPLESVACMEIVQSRFRKSWNRMQSLVTDELVQARGKVLLIEVDSAMPSFLHFMLYLRYPFVGVSILVKEQGDYIRLELGENIFYRVNTVDLGYLVKQYGGGGHKYAAGCIIPKSQKQEIIDRIVAVLN